MGKCNSNCNVVMGDKEADLVADREKFAIHKKS